jgi:hypothetical protein
MSSSCVFANAILSSRAKCAWSKKECIAEKEFAVCVSADNLNKCKQVYDFLRENSKFAVSGVGQANLSVGQQNKIRIGGLFALSEIIYHHHKIEDVSLLIDVIILQYPDLADLPMQQILPIITNFKIRNN